MYKEQIPIANTTYMMVGKHSGDKAQYVDGINIYFAKWLNGLSLEKPRLHDLSEDSAVEDTIESTKTVVILNTSSRKLHVGESVVVVPRLHKNEGTLFITKKGVIVPNYLVYEYNKYKQELNHILTSLRNVSDFPSFMNVASKFLGIDDPPAHPLPSWAMKSLFTGNNLSSNTLFLEICESMESSGVPNDNFKCFEKLAEVAFTNWNDNLGFAEKMEASRPLLCQGPFATLEKGIKGKLKVPLTEDIITKTTNEISGNTGNKENTQKVLSCMAAFNSLYEIYRRLSETLPMTGIIKSSTNTVINPGDCFTISLV